MNNSGVEVRYSNPPIKFYVALGSFFFVTIIASMIIFPDIWRIGIYFIIGGVTVWLCSAGVIKILQGAVRATDVYHKLAMQANERKYLRVPRTDNLYCLSSGQIVIDASQQQQPVRQLDEPQRNALDLLNDGHHFLLVGDTGSGKTTLANHLIKRIGKKNAIICDPHAKLNEWLAGVPVIQSYDGIITVMERVFSILKYRIDNGLDNEHNIVLAIDEVPSVVDETKELGWNNIGLIFRRLSREGRKVNICLILMTQGENIDDLDLKGFSNVKKNFVKIEMTKRDKERGIATAIYSNRDKETVILPGIYNGNTQRGQIVEIENNFQSIEDRIRAAYKPDRSYREISQEVWGVGKFGSYYNERIARVINSQ